MFFWWKLILRCSRVHGSAATLTNSAACASHERVLGPRELWSDAYSIILAVFGIRHGSHGETGMVSRTAARSPPPTRAGGQDDGSYTNSLKIYNIYILYVKCQSQRVALQFLIVPMSMIRFDLAMWRTNPAMPSQGIVDRMPGWSYKSIFSTT